MNAARDKFINALTTYFKLSKAERPGISFLISNLETEMIKLGIQLEDIAALVMPVYSV